MQVKAFPLDVWGCGHYRMAWPIFAAASELGMNASVVAPEERSVLLEFEPTTGRPAREHFPVDAGDVVLIQRPSPTFMPDAIRLMQKRGVAVVVDMDDDLASVHPANPSWLMLHPKSQNGHTWHAVAESCRLADLVTVTTGQLARRYASHGRYRILPNCVPREYLQIPHSDSADIGWAGSVQTHPDDLQQVGGSIARLLLQGYTFKTVGPVNEVAKALGLQKDPPSTGSVEFAQYPHTIAQLGIGIAPLAMTRFNQAKSWLKPLEYASVGVPWVGSPTEDYLKLNREGCGEIAERPKDWERSLKRLANNELQRIELSERGRMVAARWTIEGNAWRWAEAWADAVAYRQGAVPSSAGVPH